ncbi:MAG TPA: hypothetical protein VGC88_03890 [Terriglobales bacterium]
MKTDMTVEISGEQNAFFVADLAMHGYCLMPDGSLMLNGVELSADGESLTGGPVEFAAAEQMYV